ncbi:MULTISPECIES: DUF3644 domain-containing protein [unclassified Afipia]|uniref:DUF3644 domain-containing protein n=1 Tax=unclassified Afipia TaxID=2642050 RepID=UPI0003F54482|nr:MULTISPECIES: DUF3644 domain-containing protein [unclassified Afipia]
MAIQKKGGSLTAEEKRIVKALLGEGWRNQDIQALVNIGRHTTVNSARITGVKQSTSIKPASPDEVVFYKKKKESYDWSTGLNLYDDERLIRSREAMILAVHVFNSPSCQFKTEIFAVLVNIAWTYLLHEFYIRKGVKIVASNGYSLLLGSMLGRADCPLSQGIKNNLKAMKRIRDEVEHLLLGRTDLRWSTLFQACCLNYETTIVKLFGEKLSLQRELSFALQFAKLDIDQINSFQNYEIPEKISALDANLKQGLSDKELSDLEYQFQVFYSLNSASKSAAGINFIKPGTDQAKDVNNVLEKYKLADDQYPYKPSTIAKLVAKKANKKFLLSHHTQAWRLYKVRPPKGAAQPENTNKKYCVYHSAHRDYTYSEGWVDFLSEQIATDDGFNKIKAVRP